jgi:hypothetical protein
VNSPVIKNTRQQSDVIDITSFIVAEAEKMRSVVKRLLPIKQYTQ